MHDASLPLLRARPQRPRAALSRSRLLAAARADRARRLGAAFFVWPLLGLALLALIACLA